jgi:hypothetical protein
VLFEEVPERHESGLTRFIWNPVQQPRTLTDESCELGSLGRISPKVE